MPEIKDDPLSRLTDEVQATTRLSAAIELDCRLAAPNDVLRASELAALRYRLEAQVAPRLFQALSLARQRDADGLTAWYEASPDDGWLSGMASSELLVAAAEDVDAGPPDITETTGLDEVREALFRTRSFDEARQVIRATGVGEEVEGRPTALRLPQDYGVALFEAAAAFKVAEHHRQYLDACAQLAEGDALTEARREELRTHRRHRTAAELTILREMILQGRTEMPSAEEIQARVDIEQLIDEVAA